LGDIGGRLARLAKVFDMHVVGLRRHPASGRGSADAVHAMDELNGLLPDADFVALTCPLTAETENLIDAEALSRMNPTARLVNVARGQVVDEAALIDALATRRIAGAGIDVTAEEPLAPSSPLWAMEHVLITPTPRAKRAVTRTTSSRSCSTISGVSGVAKSNYETRSSEVPGPTGPVPCFAAGSLAIHQR
jgi:phosphoglycerate dehydrogenase-like enzyme